MKSNPLKGVKEEKVVRAPSTRNSLQAARLESANMQEIALHSKSVYGIEIRIGTIRFETVAVISWIGSIDLCWNCALL